MTTEARIEVSAGEKAIQGMREFDIITITAKGQAQFPACWRKQAGLMHGGPCDVRVVNDDEPGKSVGMETRRRFFERTAPHH